MVKIKEGWEEYAKQNPKLYGLIMGREEQAAQLQKKGSRMSTSSDFKATSNAEAKEFAGAARIGEKIGDSYSGRSWERGDAYYTAFKNFMQAGRPEDAIRCEEKYIDSAPGGIQSIYGDSKKADVLKVTEHARFLEKYGRSDLAARFYSLIGDKDNYELATTVAKNKDKSQNRKELIRSGLEKITATTSLLGVFSGIFFLSNKLTGNVILMSSGNSSYIGLGLLLVGLVAGFFWIKGKK